jgi:hypothetical protein
MKKTLFPTASSSFRRKTKMTARNQPDTTVQTITIAQTAETQTQPHYGEENDNLQQSKRETTQLWDPEELFVDQHFGRHKYFIRQKEDRSSFQQNVSQQFQYWMHYSKTSGSPVITLITKTQYIKQFNKIIDYFEVKKGLKGMDAFTFLNNLPMLVSYFSWLKLSNYAMRTILNYVSALYHFCSYLESPLPPDAKVLDLNLSTDRIRDVKKWLKTQKKFITPIAIKQTKARNSLESLHDRGKWMSFSQVLVVREKVVNFFYNECDKVITLLNYPSNNTLFKIRNCVMVLLFTYGLPLRSQNLFLIIADKKQKSYEAKHNCIILSDESTSFLEYVTFKNQSYMGYQAIPISSELFYILNQYMLLFWPLFYPDNTDPLGKLFFPSFGGSKPQKIGENFAKIFNEFGGSYITPSTLRKVVETAMDDTNIFNLSERQQMSKGLLHDYSTAKQYYILTDTLKQHNSILNNYIRFCDSVTSQHSGAVAYSHSPSISNDHNNNNNNRNNVSNLNENNVEILSTNNNYNTFNNLVNLNNRVNIN